MHTYFMHINKINGFDLKFECKILKYIYKREFIVFGGTRNLRHWNITLDYVIFIRNAEFEAETSEETGS